MSYFLKEVITFDLKIYTLKYLKLIFFCFFFFTFLNSQELSLGNWDAYLKLNDSVRLPFNLTVTNKTIIIKNGEEHIPLKEPIKKENGVIYHFKAFNSYLIINDFTSESIFGYWVNKDKKNKGIIPFFALLQKNERETIPMKPTLNGKWEVTFSPTTKNAYPAIGKFKQSNYSEVYGTFLTETGDYRFLSGAVKEDGSYYLSCFDGSHVFLFKGEVKKDSIKGVFYSGRHWSTTFIGKKNNKVELENPYSITALKEGRTFEFNKKQLNGENYHFPNETTKDKVTIIQIIGSWCPNCLDETRFFKELYEDYHALGLEIIAIGYEIPKDFSGQSKRLSNYKKSLEIPYLVLVGGTARKDVASNDFNMLNEIVSFPTSILINKSGEVVNIYTGFNGPGTGEIYDNYVENTRELIEKLLKE